MLETQVLVDEAKLLNILRTLPPTAVEQLLNFALFLQSRLAAVDNHVAREQNLDQREEEFMQQLIREGLLHKITPPVTDLRPYQNRKLIEVQGKPLSEIIIEERR